MYEEDVMVGCPRCHALCDSYEFQRPTQFFSDESYCSACLWELDEIERNVRERYEDMIMGEVLEQFVEGFVD